MRVHLGALHDACVFNCARLHVLVYAFVCMFVPVCLCDACMCAYICGVHACVYMCACVYFVCVFVCARTFVCVCTCACVCTNVSCSHVCKTTQLLFKELSPPPPPSSMGPGDKLYRINQNKTH